MYAKFRRVPGLKKLPNLLHRPLNCQGLLVASLVLQLPGCTVLSIVDTAASVVVKTVETAVDWVIPD